MLTKRLYRTSAFSLLMAAALSGFLGTLKLPLSILLGGALALANLRGLSRGLERFIGTHRPTSKLMILSFLRLGLMFAVIVTLAVLRAVDLIGLAAGFTIVMVILMIEGLRQAREQQSG